MRMLRMAAKACALLLHGNETYGLSRTEYFAAIEEGVPSCSIKSLPAYAGHPFEVIDGGMPGFTKKDLSGAKPGFEEYSPLDHLGRCGTATALIGTETRPSKTDGSGTIKSVLPTGWQADEYPFVEGRKLYNRCHLIGFELAGENDNPQNLITGTHYLNHAMRVFEKIVIKHCDESRKNRVLYRATPIFNGSDLVPIGVQLEACSQDDGGQAVRFNVFLHNVQPGVRIDYATGANREDATVVDIMIHEGIVDEEANTFHRYHCDLPDDAQWRYSGDRKALEDEGYKACPECRP